MQIMKTIFLTLKKSIWSKFYFAFCPLLIAFCLLPFSSSAQFFTWVFHTDMPFTQIENTLLMPCISSRMFSSQKGFKVSSKYISSSLKFIFSKDMRYDMFVLIKDGNFSNSI